MSDYLKSTNFSTKDTLPSGNASKIVKGTELDTEFNAIASSSASKADILNPVFSGLLTTDTLTTTGAANIGGTLAVTGAFSSAADAQFTGTGRVKVPTGTTAQRPSSPTTGSLRFNTDLGYLENYDGTTWKLVAPSPTPAQVSDQLNTSTGYFQVPKGTDAQRPITPMNGLIRYNSTQDFYECYVGTAWHRFVTVNQGAYTLYYVLVGGGAGVTAAGGSARGGGGAGQILENTVPVNIGTVLTVTIAAGGAPGSTGGTTTLSGVTSATGGGTTTSGTGGTSGNGYGGGGPFIVDGNVQTSGGGGGAGQSGGSGVESLGGTGGNGVATNITGTNTYYGGGGAGGGQFGGQSAGTGGGGAAASNGSANTGGGSGGVYGSQTSSGGSGKTILKMLTIYYSATYTGSPTISTIGEYTCLSYTSSGTYTA
ncbi:hypothetical protein UFOVP507_50 [uncultured Caudovirales phage]|uniref:Glycine-rich domain-containing protein n=1 Tax=uncultured Caudovirales phage TaxID=2100421 RepID=A0A6J5MLY7_9CAUD|nr:hypothetical protein UFOVP507_50 [uncultured Caudovirales phage]